MRGTFRGMKPDLRGNSLAVDPQPLAPVQYSHDDPDDKAAHVGPPGHRLHSHGQALGGGVEQLQDKPESEKDDSRNMDKGDEEA